MLSTTFSHYKKLYYIQKGSSKRSQPISTSNLDLILYYFHILPIPSYLHVHILHYSTLS